MKKENNENNEIERDRDRDRDRDGNSDENDWIIIESDNDLKENEIEYEEELNLENKYDDSNNFDEYNDNDDDNQNENENEDNYEVDEIIVDDPVEFLCFIALTKLGIRSIFLTNLYAGMIEGTVFFFPFYFGYSVVSGAIQKFRTNPPPIQSIFSGVAKKSLHRSFATGIFFGLTTGIGNYVDDYFEDSPQVDEFLRLTTTIGTSLALSIAAYRRPKYILPNLSILTLTAYFGYLP